MFLLKEMLECQKKRLEVLMDKKENAKKQLEDELCQTKAENKHKQDEAKKVKEQLLEDFTNVLETELKCSICNELFIKVDELL